ncbi:MAG: transglycosylase SLT domain-containing protein, partial [Myxococcaceae bacterium]
ADLKAVALRFPGHAYAALALEQLRKIRPKTLHFSFDERLNRAKAFLDSDPEATLAELTTIASEKLAKGGSAKARMAYVRAQAYFAQGKKEEALAQIETARGGQASIAADATLLKARALLKVDDHAGAKTLLQEIDQRWPKEGAGDDAGYLLGWIDLQDGKFDEAVDAFAAFEKKHPRSPRRDEALWFRALTEVRRNQFTNARTALTQLLKQYPRSGLVPQARYWVARCAQLEASTALASQGYRELISLFPGSFYSVLASERLRELNETPPAGFPAPPKLMKAESLPQLALAQALSQAGLFKDAGHEVSWQIAHVRNQTDALKFGHALSAISEFGAAHALASRQLWGAAFGSKIPEALALFYPRAYAESVETESKTHSLDPFIVWAIMRRESAFRAEVMSGANARGLMQLIPPTATAIAKELQLPAPDPDELFSPELNIKMGAWYLSKLLERFQLPALVAAASNAGPNAAGRWMKEKGDLPLDLFVEVIPFKETRGYVKQVVADYLTYHTFYDGKPPRVALAIPMPSEKGVTF